VSSYLQENIHYSLDTDCLEGLRLFYQYAQEMNALAATPPLRFHKLVRQTVA
jgi:predicted solute-binding protein